MDGQAELTCVAGYIQRRFTCSQTVTIQILTGPGVNENSAQAKIILKLLDKLSTFQICSDQFLIHLSDFQLD